MSGRPALDGELLSLLQALVTAAPEVLDHVDPQRILVVAAAARKDAHASIRPLSFGGHPPRYVRDEGRLHKPRVEVEGREMLYEIALRPRFFLEAKAEERVAILVHELHHVSPDFDGTLAEARRHRNASPESHDRAVRAVVEAWLARDAAHFSAVTGPREVTLRAWRSRPPSRLLDPRRERALYTEADLYPAIIQLWD